MSGMDQFLGQYYGTASAPEPTQEDVEKVAQAEMFLKLAQAHGVDVNSLTDEQVNDLWNATWQQEKSAEEAAKEEHEEEKGKKEVAKKAKEEHEKEKEGEAKFAEADYMGKIMAHSYVAELSKIADEAGDLADAGHEVADDTTKARSSGGFFHRAGNAGKRVGKWMGGMESQPGGKHHYSLAREALHKGKDEVAKRKWGEGLKHIGKGTGKMLAAPAAIAATVYGAKKLFGHKKEEEGEKSSSANLDYLAAEYALQKLAADNWDTEEGVALLNQVLENGPDASDKIAYVNDLPDAVDVRSSELLEAAGYPIDWAGTPFEKTALHGPRHQAEVQKLMDLPITEDERGRIRRGFDATKGGLGAAAKYLGEGFKGTGLNTKGKRLGALGRTAAAYGSAAAALTGTGLAAHHFLKHKDKEEEHTASVNFDLAAADYAIQKAAEVGWNPEEAASRIQAVFTLGGEGDPKDSEKVAATQSEDQALVMRGCELLELAGYTINW